MSAIIEAVAIEKSYAGAAVVEASSLCLQEAAITALCGPNGAGKSTLLRMISLIEYPDQGQIGFRGKKLTSRGDWFAARKSITMVDQNPYAFHGSVHYNVAYGLKLRGVAEPELSQQVAEALAAVGLEQSMARRARTLSGGEIQRMAIARAIVCEPALLALDEPTAHVDAARVRDIEDLIVKLKKEKQVSIIIATHDHDQACRLADKVLWIEKGMIGEDTAKIVDAVIERQGDVLVAKIDARLPAPPNTRVTALELAGDHALVRLENNLPLIRVSVENLENAAPLLGDKVELRSADRTK